MKANELRLGNLYKQFGNITEVTWCTIKDLINAPEEQLWCKPIQLTEEWLLKFGFEKSNSFYWKNWGKNGSFIVVKDNIYGFKVEFGKGFYLIVNEVHRFQNVYFDHTTEQLIIEL